MSYMTTFWRKTGRNLAIYLCNDLLPADLQRFASMVIERNALVSYLDVTTVEQVLERISRRSQRFETLATAGEPMRENYSQLRSCFDDFFPDLVEHIAPFISPS